MILNENIQITQEDNMALMARYPDNHFDLAVVDPEYGIGAGKMTMGSGKNKKYSKKEWDKKPPKQIYFDELFRISKHQIICGGNYFADKLPISRGWIFWDKGINGDSSFADGELIWTSFDTVLRKANIRYKGFLGADKQRIHITQKPVKLYEWIFLNYANKGTQLLNDFDVLRSYRVLDTHLGSGSIAIAVHNVNKKDQMNLSLTACELDEDYYNDGIKRIKTHLQQLTIF